MLIHRARRAPRFLALAALLSLCLPAAAAEHPRSSETAEAAEDATSTQAAPDEDRTRRPLFPPFRKKAKDSDPTDVDDRVQADDGARDEVQDLDADRPAEELTEDGIWEWVDRMDGEIPSDEQVEGIEEKTEEEQAERRLIDDLTGRAPPVDLYRDPTAAMASDPLFLDLVDPSEFDIPIEVNASVEKWVTYFTGPGRKYYAKWLGRSTRYRPMMYEKLEAAGMPRDLVYLSMIESGYNAHAYSHAAAAGLWQFIPSTARLYDMRVDWWQDDRRDPEASVGAAIAFLSELHTMFDGDWRLAWAAYNGGPGRIRGATRKSGSKDFWTIANGPYLHPETDNYVPKIMAAAIIGHHPERYGFTGIEFQEELEYDVARVEGSVELSVIAECAGTTLDEIKALNPALRRYATPSEGYDVRVPKGKVATFMVAIADVPPAKRLLTVRHTVRRGETLSVIASKYGTSVSSISSANGLQNANRIYVGMSLVIPRGASGTVATASNSRSDAPSGTSSRSSSSSASKASSYTVRSGDSLSGIASRHGVSTSQLRSWNGLKSSTIHPGQKLALKGGSTAGTSSSGTTKLTHVVRRGETLSTIASKYRVRQSDLQRWNSIRNASHITVGQKLTVHSSGGSSSSSSFSTYTVQRGDSLGKIATKYGCSVTDLKSWNKLRSSVIQPGQKLKVRKG